MARDSKVIEATGALGIPGTWFAGFARLPFAHVVAATHTVTNLWHRVDNLRTRTGIVRERGGPSQFLLDLDRKSYRNAQQARDIAPEMVIIDEATVRPESAGGPGVLSYQQRVVDRSDGSKYGFSTTRWSTNCRVAFKESQPPCADFRLDIASEIEVASTLGASFGHQFVPHDTYGTEWYGTLMTRFVRSALAEMGCSAPVTWERDEQSNNVVPPTPEVGHFLLFEKIMIDVVEWSTEGVLRDHIVLVRDRGEVELRTVDVDIPPLDGLRREGA